MKRLMAPVFLVFFVAGCSTMSQRARTEGTLGGAGVGALIGGALGAALGAIARDPVTGAIAGASIGALIGGAVGYSYADRVAQRHQQLAGKENDLDARIAFVQGINQDTEDINRRLEQEIASSEENVNGLTVQIKKHEVTQQKLEKEKLALAKKVKDAESQLKLASEQLDDIKKFRGQYSQSSVVLDSQISKLEGQVAHLRNNVTILASLGQRI